MPTTSDQTSSVQALRNAFGDSGPPNISRKITACVACRKQKIKCPMPSSGPPCTRCRIRGLSCTVNRSLQMLLESDTLWKSSVEEDMRRVKSAIERLATHASLPEVIQSLREDGVAPNQNSDIEDQRPPSRDSIPRELIIDPASGPEAPPASYLSSRPAPSATQPQADMISRGKISYDDAQACIHLYSTKLDHYPYRIFVDQGERNLDTIRAASPFLLAAICSVGTLHTAAGDFDACYQEFLAMHSNRNFAKDINLDDVRALCIGAFWLSDVSWTLVSTAVRIATELQLHRSFRKALQGDREHYLRARLYFLVYACDHQFSIPYGRPPLTREDDAIRNVRSFLHCAHASEDDARLVSQVLRWSLCTNVFDAYGTNTDTPLSELEITQLRTFNMSLDRLRTEWGDRFVINPHVGNYPSKGVALQCDFAKLYMCSHAFRGSSTSQVVHRSQTMTLSIDNIAHEGIISALSIINTVITDDEIQSFFNGLPVYFHIMLAFSVVFLFKLCKLPASFRLDVQATKRSVRSLVEVLKQIAAMMHPRHLLVDLTKGIGSLLQEWGTNDTGLTDIEVLPSCQTEEPSARPSVDIESAWFDGLLDPRFIGEYDILMGQDTDFGI